MTKAFKKINWKLSSSNCTGKGGLWSLNRISCDIYEANQTQFTQSSKYPYFCSQKLELQSVSESFEILKISDATELNTLEYDSAEYYSFKFSTNEDLDIIIKKVFMRCEALIKFWRWRLFITVLLLWEELNLNQYN